jgi:glycerol-3-phosphate dehydrogenase
VREEMAQNLVDVVRRRTELGAAGLPRKADLHRFAEIMGKELGWSSDQIAHEISEVVTSYPFTTNVVDSKGR